MTDGQRLQQVDVGTIVGPLAQVMVLMLLFGMMRSAARAMLPAPEPQKRPPLYGSRGELLPHTRGKGRLYWWVRLGDVADYERFDTFEEAKKRVKEATGLPFEQARWSRLHGFELGGFLGWNYISFFEGDEEGQPTERYLYGEGLPPALPATRPKRYLSREDVRVEVWEERDRLHIGIQDRETGEYIASWWDEEAREMFEQGFFKRGRALEESVLSYAEEVGLLESP